MQSQSCCCTIAVAMGWSDALDVEWRQAKLTRLLDVEGRQAAWTLITLFLRLRPSFAHSIRPLTAQPEFIIESEGARLAFASLAAISAHL
eukprot:1133438-Pelagomonas_calceolata.AAC.8